MLTENPGKLDMLPLGTDHLISGGGGGGGLLGFFLTTSYFFSLFAQQVFFSKVNCNKCFFSKNNTLKSEKCKRKQHIE